MNPDYLTPLNVALRYAEIVSGCTKVKVGCIIMKTHEDGHLQVGLGANRVIGNTCTEKGCNRVRKYGDNDKTHRAPDDCLSLHSEIDAICGFHDDTRGAEMFITRYPCEACARAIVAAGISKVVYAGKQRISSYTEDLFARAGVLVEQAEDFQPPDVEN